MTTSGWSGRKRSSSYTCNWQPAFPTNKHKEVFASVMTLPHVISRFLKLMQIRLEERANLFVDRKNMQWIPYKTPVRNRDEDTLLLLTMIINLQTPFCSWGLFVCLSVLVQLTLQRCAHFTCYSHCTAASQTAFLPRGTNAPGASPCCSIFTAYFPSHQPTFFLSRERAGAAALSVFSTQPSPV